MKKQIYNVIILDESGSMEAIKLQAIGGYNETIQTIRGSQKELNDTQQHYLTLVTFNGSGIKTVYDRVPIENAEKLDSKSYRPDADTPLFDAMGLTFTKLRFSIADVKEPEVLVTIITDGEENSSKEFNRNMIKNMVDDLKQLGWVFTYIGANQDVEKVAHRISITNTLSFDSSMEGTQTMFIRENANRKSYYSKINDADFKEQRNTHYFKDKESE